MLHPLPPRPEPSSTIPYVPSTSSSSEVPVNQPFVRPTSSAASRLPPRPSSLPARPAAVRQAESSFAPSSSGQRVAMLQDNLDANAGGPVSVLSTEEPAAASLDPGGEIDIFDAIDDEVSLVQVKAGESSASQVTPPRKRKVVKPGPGFPSVSSKKFKGKPDAPPFVRAEFPDAQRVAPTGGKKKGKTSNQSVNVKPELQATNEAYIIPSKRCRPASQSRTLLVPMTHLPVYPLPPLPRIEDPVLERQVFTHSSCFSFAPTAEMRRVSFLTPDDQAGRDYEKLEHVGDALLGTVVTVWLHELHPALDAGKASQLKSHLVSNATLSHFSGMYNLPERICGPPELLPLLRVQADVRADVFESYIAAVLYSHPPEKRMTEGFAVITKWLREMYEPMRAFLYKYMEDEFIRYNLAIGTAEDGTVIVMDGEEMHRIDSTAMGMHSLVQCYAQSKARTLRYEEEVFETSVGHLWKYTCIIDGVEMGSALRARKKIAKHVAAWEAAKKLGLTNENTVLH